MRITLGCPTLSVARSVESADVEATIVRMRAGAATAAASKAGIRRTVSSVALLVGELRHLLEAQSF